MKDDAQLAEIAARAEAATPGPWESARSSDDTRQWVTTAKDDVEFLIGCDDDEYVRQLPVRENAAFIAAARTDVPLLLEEVKRLRGIVASQQQDLQHYDDVMQTLRAVEALPEKWRNETCDAEVPCEESACIVAHANVDELSATLGGKPNE